MRELPAGMIQKIEPIRWRPGYFMAMIGYPTRKGNFSIGLGRWAGVGVTQEEAVQNAIEQFYSDE